MKNQFTKEEALELIGASPTSIVDELISKVPSSSYYILTSDDYGGDSGLVIYETVQEAQLAFRAIVEHSDFNGDFLSSYFFSKENPHLPDTLGLEPRPSTRRLLGYRASFQEEGPEQLPTEQEEFYTRDGAIKERYSRLGQVVTLEE